MVQADTDLNHATEINRGRIVIGAVTSYGVMVYSAAVGLFLQAFIIRKLGRNGYALWPLAGTCMSFLGLIGTAVGAGACRFMAHALGTKRPNDIACVTSSLFLAMSGAACLSLFTAGLMSRFFEVLFDIPSGSQGVGPRVVLILGMSSAIALPFSVFHAALYASQRFVVIGVLRASKLAARVALVVLIFQLHGGSLVALASVLFVLELVFGLTEYGVARRYVPGARVRFSAVRWSVLRRTTTYGGLSLLLSLAGLLYWKTDNIVINKLVDPAALTGYSVIVAFVLHCYQFANQGCGVLLPAATILHAQGNIPRLARLIYRANRIVVPIAVPVLLFLMLFGPEIIAVYIGAEYSDFAWPLQILAGSLVISCPQTSSQNVPRAFGRLAIPTVLSMTSALLNVAISVFLVAVCNLGVAGVAWGTAVVAVLGRGIVQPWYISRWFLHTPFLTHFKNTTLIPLAHCLLVASTLVLVRVFARSEGWVLLVIATALGCVVHGTYMLLTGLPMADRRFLATKLMYWLRPAADAEAPCIRHDARGGTKPTRRRR